MPIFSNRSNVVVVLQTQGEGFDDEKETMCDGISVGKAIYPAHGHGVESSRASPLVDTKRAGLCLVNLLTHYQISRM